MANALFDSGRAKFLEGSIAAGTDTLRVLFVDHADDTPVPATDDFLDDIATAARVPAGTGGTQSNHPALASKTTTAGVLDAADLTFSALTGDPSESIVIYKGTGTDASSPLIAFFDTATGLPFTPNGGDAIIVWAASSPNIFKL